MKRPVVKYVLETIIPKLRDIGESLTYLHIPSRRTDELYYGEYTIQYIKGKGPFILYRDIIEVSPEDVVSRIELLQCLKEDLIKITHICAEHNSGIDYMFSEYEGILASVYPILPNIRTGAILDNGGKLIFLGPLTPGFDEERELAESSREMGSRINYVLDNKLYFKDVIEFAYHYRNSLMKFG